MKLIQNGPDVHPGAKIDVQKNGQSISLRYFDRNTIILKKVIKNKTVDSSCPSLNIINF